MIEEWRDIPGFEGYQVSNFGQIRSMNYRHKKGEYRVLKGYLTTCGYKVVKIRRKSVLVNRAVALAFIPNPQNKSEVDHIDGNRLNNRLDNLRWVTHSENIHNPITLAGMRLRSIGEKNPFYGKHHKPETVAYIRSIQAKRVGQFSLSGELIRVWNSTMDIQRELGIPNSNISRCCLEGRPTARGYRWKYI